MFILYHSFDSPRARRLCNLFTSKHVIVSRFDIYICRLCQMDKKVETNNSICQCFMYMAGYT